MMIQTHVGKNYVILLNLLGTKAGMLGGMEAALEARGVDWLRFSGTGYLVHTQLTAESLYHIVKPLLHPNDFVLVCEANLPNRQGWASKVAIDWIKKQAP